jgi:hypothetical protein
MTGVRSCELPATSFLHACREAGAYADCYVITVDGVVSQATFVEAFYTTALFKVERAILKWLAARPSSDIDAKRLAEGTTGSFAAWRVERRTADQLLLADFTGRTKSWLMTSPEDGSDVEARTRLYFGSAVVSHGYTGSGTPRLGFGFRALLGFHRLYSRLLLGAARARIVDAMKRA